MQALSPSSSTTTPSPSLAFVHPPGHLDPSDRLADVDPQEREERQRAVKKFLARAECSKLTRALRARLAYASYKASNNLEHVPLPVLEHRIHPPSPSPTPPAPPPTSPYPPSHKRRILPAAASPSRTSLYSSLLGPPPSKRPRHVYGPASSPTLTLPLQPPYSPTPSPSRRKHHRQQQQQQQQQQQSPQQRRTAPASPFVNGGQGRTVRTVLQGRARSNVTEKEDMNAAATLTALMFNRASPRQQRKDDSSSSSARALLAPPQPQRTATPPVKGTEDADAAELMLYLATSPSPVRPSVAKRTPGSVGMGRVLFKDGGREKDKSMEKEGQERDGAMLGVAVSQSSSTSSQTSVQSSQGSMPSLSLSQGSTLSSMPSLSLSQDTAPSLSSQDTMPSSSQGAMQLLPPPPSPPHEKAVPYDVSRRLFVDTDVDADAEAAPDRRGLVVVGVGVGGVGAGEENGFGVRRLEKGIDLVEAK